MFVNLNNPTQNKRREVRKLVRSHVSHIQHSLKRTELGQVQKPSKSRYTDRSVNGWAVLDESRAAHPSQRKVNAASGLDSSLLPQHQSTSSGSAQSRSPRRLHSKNLAVAGKSRRHSRQSQCQPKDSHTPLTPTSSDGIKIKEESPQVVSIPSTVKSETDVTSSEGVCIKRDPDRETNRRLDIVSEHSLRSQSLTSSSALQWSWKGDDPARSSPAPLYFSLGDPTDELRNRIELAGIGMSSTMVSTLLPLSLEMQ